MAFTRDKLWCIVFQYFVLQFCSEFHPSKKLPNLSKQLRSDALALINLADGELMS